MDANNPVSWSIYKERKTELCIWNSSQYPLAKYRLNWKFCFEIYLKATSCDIKLKAKFQFVIYFNILYPICSSILFIR